MKRCPYCGKQYADDAGVCSVDSHPLEDPAQTRENGAARHVQNGPAFNARVISHGVSSGVYRIYVRGSDLLFIQIEAGDMSKNWEAIAALLGPVGVGFGLLFKLRSERKAKGGLSRVDERDPEDLLHENKHNFKLYIPEIRDAAMEPPARVAFSGKQAGRLNLFIRDGKRMKLEFLTADEMKTALEMLTPLLYSTLRINVEWNEAGHRFQEKKKPAAAARNS